MTYTMPILTDDVARGVAVREIADAIIIGIAVVAVILIALFWRRRRKRFQTTTFFPLGPSRGRGARLPPPVAQEGYACCGRRVRPPPMRRAGAKNRYFVGLSISSL